MGVLSDETEQQVNKQKNKKAKFKNILEYL